jgi:hypothetical protein
MVRSVVLGIVNQFPHVRVIGLGFCIIFIAKAVMALKG